LGIYYGESSALDHAALPLRSLADIAVGCDSNSPLLGPSQKFMQNHDFLSNHPNAAQEHAIETNKPLEVVNPMVSSTSAARELM
jgi:hypothetical protein